MSAITSLNPPIGDFSVHQCHDLKPQHRYMLAFLIENAAEWADKDGWVKFGRRSLGERLGLDHAMVRRLITALEKAGYLQVETGGGAQKYSRYKLVPKVLNHAVDQRVISDPVTKAAPVQNTTGSNQNRSNIVPLNRGEKRRKQPNLQNHHRVPTDSHRFESELSKKDSIRVEDTMIEKLTRLFLDERAKAHPFAKPINENKTRQAVQQCLDDGINPEILAANIAGGMKRGRFADDPPSSPLAFKRSAAEDWGGPNFRNPTVKLGETKPLPKPGDIAGMDADTQESLFMKVQQSLRLRSPQKAALLQRNDIASWAAYIRADFL